MRGPAAALAATLWAAAALAEPAAERGRALYDGTLPLRATIAEGAPLPAALAACVRCHRPSGCGTSEGNARTPAIAAPVLFAPLTPRRDLLLRDLFQERYGAAARMAARTPRLRPACAGAADLARALREGVDPAGNPLSPTMPRYRIDDDQAAALTAYLRALNAAPDPGYDDKAWHFATVIAPGAPEARGDASLAVMRAYVDRHNREISRERARPGFSPGYKAEYARARRLWRLTVWRLDGTPDTWGGQLRALHSADPPFAILGGLAPDWSPVAAFCDATGTPCVFPQTDWPAPDTEGQGTLYLDGGLPAEAALIARAAEAAGARRLAIVSGAGIDARRLAAAASSAAEGLTLVAAPEEADAVALFLSPGDLAAGLPDLLRLKAALFAAGGLIADGDDRLQVTLPSRIRIAWRFADPDHSDPERLRLRGWLRARGVDAPGQERAQLQTWLALEITRHAIERLVDRPSRAFFVETIEHLAEAGLDPGLYPAFTLGPGQRVAAKGGALLAPDRPPNRPPGAAAASVVRYHGP